MHSFVSGFGNAYSRAVTENYVIIFWANIGYVERNLFPPLTESPIDIYHHSMYDKHGHLRKDIITYPFKKYYKKIIWKQSN